MRLFVIGLILTIDGAIGHPQSANGGASGEVSGGSDVQAGGDGAASSEVSGGMSGEGNLQGNAQLGSCKGQASASGSGNANANGANGQGGGSASGDASANGSVDGCTDPGQTPIEAKGFPIPIKARKTLQGYSSNSVVRAINVPNDSNITYKMRVDVDKPLWFDGELSLDGKKVYEATTKKPINSCGTYDDGTWPYVITMIYKKGFTGGDCPVEPGTYPCPQMIPPFITTFDEKPKCGEYTWFGYADNSKKQWSLSVEWKWVIDGENCTPS